MASLWMVENKNAAKIPSSYFASESESEPLKRWIVHISVR